MWVLVKSRFSVNRYKYKEGDEMLQQFQAGADVEFMAAALSCIGDGVIVADKQGVVLFINAAGEELTGWNSVEAKDKHFDEVFPLVNFYTQERLESPVKIAHDFGIAIGLQNHSALVAKNGCVKFVSASCSPIKSPEGDIQGVVVVFRDITCIKKMEEDLRRERNNLKNVFEALPISVLVVDDQAVVKWANCLKKNRSLLQLWILRNKRNMNRFSKRPKMRQKPQVRPKANF